MQPATLHRLSRNDSILSELFLRGSCMGSKGAAQLAAALKGNTTLRSLHLPLSFIGPEGLAQLVPFLTSEHCPLSDLDLSDCDLGDESCFLVAEILKFNKSLENLTLSDNEITDNGLLAISNALVQNSTLRSLSLAGNRISDCGVKGLCEAVVRSQVRAVDLSSNLITEEGATTLALAVASGALMLHSIRLENNDIGEAGASKLRTILRHGPQTLSFGKVEEGTCIYA